VTAELEKLGAKVTPARRQEILALLAQAEASEKAATRAEDERKAKEELLRLSNALAVAERNRAQADSDAIAAVGLGAREVERQRRRLEIERDYEKGVQQLRDKGVAEGSASYRQQEAALRASRDRMLEAESNFWQRMDAARSDWTNGASKALTDYLDGASDVAGQTQSVFSNAFKGLEDVVVQFATTGKASFSDFANSILADITRMMTQKAVAQFVQMLFGAFGGSGVTRESFDYTAGTQVSDINFFGGGRAVGGPVSSGKIYEVGEGGRPELFQQGGRTYLIPGNAGTVVPASMSGVGSLERMGLGGGAGGGEPQVNVTIHNAPEGADVQSRRNEKGGLDIDVIFRQMEGRMANNLANGAGPVHAALRGRYALQERM